MPLIPIDSLRPFRDQFLWSRPEGYSKVEAYTQEKFNKLSDEDKKKDTIYLVGDKDTNNYDVYQYDDKNEIYSKVNKQISLDDPSKPLDFLEITKKLDYSQDAYFWENPFKNYIAYYWRNTINNEDEQRLQNKVEDCMLLTIITMKDISKKDISKIDNEINIFTKINNQFFMNILIQLSQSLGSLLRAIIPGFFSMLFEEAERAFAKRSPPWEKSKVKWLIFAIPRGFFYLLKQPFKWAENAIAIAFQTIDFILTILYAGTNVICGGFKKEKRDESWELLKEAFYRLYSITLVRSLLLAFTGAAIGAFIIFVAPKILALLTTLGIGGSIAGLISIIISAVTGTVAATATEAGAVKAADKGREKCCSSSNNEITHSLKEQKEHKEHVTSNNKIPIDEKKEEKAELMSIERNVPKQNLNKIKALENKMESNKLIVVEGKDVKIPPIIANIYNSITKITIGKEIGPFPVTIEKITMEYKLKELTEEEREKFKRDRNEDKIYNSLIKDNKPITISKGFKSQLLTDENTSTPKSVLANFPMFGWCPMIVTLASIGIEHDANFLMKTFFISCSERCNLLNSSNTRGKDKGTEHMYEAISLLMFVYHLSKMLDPSDAKAIEGILDTNHEAKLSIVNIYKKMQTEYNFLVRDKNVNLNSRDESDEILKKNLIKMFEQINTIAPQYANTNWNDIALKHSQQTTKKTIIVSNNPSTTFSSSNNPNKNDINESSLPISRSTPTKKITEGS